MDDWRRLTEDQDIDGLLALTADDVVFLTPGNPPTGKAEFAEGLRTVFAKAGIAPTQDVREIRTSGDMGYAWSQLSVEVIPKDGPESATRATRSQSFAGRRRPAGRPPATQI